MKAHKPTQQMCAVVLVVGVLLLLMHRLPIAAAAIHGLIVNPPSSRVAVLRSLFFFLCGLYGIVNQNVSRRLFLFLRLFVEIPKERERDTQHT